MLSKIAFRTVKNANFIKKSTISISAIRASAATSKGVEVPSVKEFTIYAEKGKRFPWEGPERDLINFPRPVQPEYPGKVRFLFVPDEWFQYFYKKTGVTGPYVLGIGIWTYVMSKEVWLVEHEYYYVYATIGIFWIADHKFGDTVASLIDKKVDEDTAELKAVREGELQEVRDEIADEKHLQWQSEAQLLVIEAKKENVAIQQEAFYRERSLEVYNEVRNRLEFHSQKQLMERRISQKHMVNWIVNQVKESITPEEERNTLQKCIVELQAIANRA